MVTQRIKAQWRAWSPASYARLTRLRSDLAVARWRWQNLGRVVGAPRSPRDGAPAGALVRELRQEGIAIRRLSDLLPHRDHAFFAHVEAAARQRWEAAKSGTQRAEEGSNKEYKLSLLPRTLPFDDPFVRLALDPHLLQVVRSYLGLHPMLRAIELWWDYPTEGPPKETQLWHRDGDDVMNVKVFVYFTDVDVGAGPFCFLPGTHPRGRRRDLCAEHRGGRSTDDQMAVVAPKATWRVCTAPAGTAILCDTCGYHKGLKPSHRERLMLMVQYTSGTPRYPKMVQVAGEADGLLNRAQRYALAGES